MDRETADEIKRHFNVVAEGLRSEIRLVAEAQIGTIDKLDRMESQMVEGFRDLDRRITSLEARLTT